MPNPPAKCYIVAFEVTSTNNVQFIEKIKSYGWYCPINANCWAIVTEKTALAIRDHLMVGLGTTDRIFVIRSGTEAAWLNSYGPQYDEWLQKNL